MKIFIDAHVFDACMQGSRTYIHGLYRELIVDNRDILFFFGAYKINGLKEEFGEHPNVRFVKYFTKNKFIRLAFNIPFILIKYKIDISHFQYITPIIKVSKEIVTIHDVLFLDFPGLFPWSYRLQNKFLFKRSARRADYILTVSGYSQKRISHHFKIKEERIHIIPDGISEEFFKKNEELPDVRLKYDLVKYLLYVSRIEPRKNHLTLLKVFVEMNLWNEGYKLVFIGSKSLNVKSFYSYLNSLPEEILKSVIIIGSSKGNELKSFYQNCSLFIYPSIAEGFGIPPLEAIASYAPVLCSKSTAMSDFSFLGESLFDPESMDELKNKISIYLKTGMTGTAEKAEFIRKNYNWKNSAAIYSKVIFRDDKN